MNKQELIKIYEDTNCTLISINGVLEDLRQLDEPQSMKLKDVIARIKKLDIGTQKVWLNEILNELGSDYGTLKYKAGYEQGEFDGSMEHEKVTIPQFVADWIEECKNDDFHLFGAMEGISLNQKKLDYWFREDDNMELFARAWLDGYEVEEEKRYLVKVHGVSKYSAYLNCDVDVNKWYMSSEINYSESRTHHTRKELEEAGFGEVFDSPLFEVKEVEE